MDWLSTWDRGDCASVWDLTRRRGAAQELARRVWRNLNSDNVPGLAAQASYYFVLALFPFLITLAALVGCLPFTGLWNSILAWVTYHLPWESQQLILQTVIGLTRGRGSYLSLGLVGTAWAACSGFMNLMGSLNAAYEVRETRSYWKRAVLAFGMVVVFNLVFLGSFGLLSAGDWLDRQLLAEAGPWVVVLWKVGRWVLSLTLLALAIAVLDYSLPDLKRPWHCLSPGTLFVVMAWIPAMLGFNYYIVHFTHYGKTYGTLAAFVILMIWMYIASLMVLTGAEINSELHKMRIDTKARAAKAQHVAAPALRGDVERGEWRPHSEPGHQN